MSGSADTEAAYGLHPKSVRRRRSLLVLLAFTSGAIDATGLLALGGVFTSVMTGNLIFMGSGVVVANWRMTLRALIAIAAFMTGALLGTRIAGTPRAGDPPWPRVVSMALGVELVLLLGFSAGWWLTDAHPSGATRLLLLVTDALALGIQSSAVLRFGIQGLSTTYMTGTLTSIVHALAARRHPRNVVSGAQILGGLVCGAGLAALAHAHVPGVVPVVAFGPVALVLILAQTIHQGGLRAHDGLSSALAESGDPAMGVAPARSQD